jgi:N-acetylneuraminate synthase
MRLLCVESELGWRALGSVSYGPAGEESASLKFRRSLYVTRDMAMGERFTAENLRAIRPGLGLPARYYETLIGKRVSRPVKKGTPADWDMVG